MRSQSGATKSNKRGKMHVERDFCPGFASFVRAGHERFMSPSATLTVQLLSIYIDAGR
jgi:hypothetical protein